LGILEFWSWGGVSWWKSSKHANTQGLIHAASPVDDYGNIVTEFECFDQKIDYAVSAGDYAYGYALGYIEEL